MFGHISDLETNYRWFLYAAPDPCANDWSFVWCNEDGRVTQLQSFNKVGDAYGNEFIDTTYWPEKLEMIYFNNPLFDGMIQLGKNLPNSTQTIVIFGEHSNLYMVINGTDFPNLSHLQK